MLKIKLARHPDYKLEGDNLISDLELTPWEAALGTDIGLQTLEGRIKLKIPAGSQNGKRLKLKGRGWSRKDGARGDHLVNLKIQIPHPLTAEESALFEELKNTSRFNPRES